ncbi:MAG: tetratricopeptide repeat protein [Candidatus Krumholzibacteriia bacterium]
MKEAHEAMGTFEYSRAERLLLDAIEVLPEDPLLHHNLAVLYMRQDRLLDARPEFERAASLYEAESNEVRAEEYFQLALIDVQERKWQEAERHLELAIESHPMRPLLHLRLIDLQLSFLRLPARADSSTARFLRLCGRTPEHLRDAAYVHHQRSSFPTSIALAREAASAVDTMITAHVIAAKSYWKSGRIDEGLSYLEGPLARYVDSPELWVARGSLQIGGGRHEEALESIGKALEVDPQNYPAHLARLMALFNATRFEEALEQANHCKELTDNDEELRFLRAQIGRIRERMRGRDDDPPSYGREGASPGARP